MGGPLVIDPRFRLQVVAGEGLFVLSETSRLVFRGQVFESLPPLLDGRFDADGVVDALSDMHGAAPALYYALHRLQSAGVVMTTVPGMSAARTAWWRELGYDPAVAEAQVTSALVGVCDLTVDSTNRAAASSALDLVIAALRRAGVPAVAADSTQPGQEAGVADAPFLVVLADDYLQVELEAINAAALTEGRPWLLVKLVGQEIWVGPVFRPGQTACWECLAQRLRGNRDVATYLAIAAGWPAPVSVAAIKLPSTIAFAADVTALTLLRILGEPDDRPDTQNGGDARTELRTFNTINGDSASHILVRRPQCPACGNAGPRGASTPLPLPATEVLTSGDAGYRTVSAERTLATYGHHVSPITGAVTDLTRAPVSDADLIRVYVAGHNLAVPAADLAGLRLGLRSASCGKGITDEQARASALCEALERYSGRLRGDEPTIRSSYAQLGDEAVHPNDCMLFSASQYASAEEWSAYGSAFAVVPEPFDELAVVEWTPVWSLPSGPRHFLPTGYCYYAAPGSSGAQYYRADSNGCAAGNTLTEAVLQGFLELVERDCVAVWWYNRLRRPGLDLASFHEPYLDRLTDEYARLGRTMWVLDLTHDLEIPAFVAVSCRTDAAAEEILMGFGAHLDARIGLLRAVTELNQMLSHTSMLEVPPDQVLDHVAVHWARTATIASQPYLAPDPSMVPRRWEDFGDPPRHLDLWQAVDHCRSIVEARGMQVLVLDQTRPDIGLAVAKVIVPGLRPFWARFAPGRLFDVPVELGWLPERLGEDELNPTPMFL